MQNYFRSVSDNYAMRHNFHVDEIESTMDLIFIGWKRPKENTKDVQQFGVCCSGSSKAYVNRKISFCLLSGIQFLFLFIRCSLRMLSCSSSRHRHVCHSVSLHRKLCIYRINCVNVWAICGGWSLLLPSIRPFAGWLADWHARNQQFKHWKSSPVYLVNATVPNVFLFIYFFTLRIYLNSKTYVRVSTNSRALNVARLSIHRNVLSFTSFGVKCDVDDEPLPQNIVYISSQKQNSRENKKREKNVFNGWETDPTFFSKCYRHCCGCCY